MIETQTENLSPTTEQLECCKHQARFYAKLANIALDDFELDEYAHRRLSIEDLPLPSDQRLLFSILAPEKQIVFRQTFSSIELDEENLN